jgi:hypothetical protein
MVYSMPRSRAGRMRQRRVVAVLPPDDVRAHAAQRAGDASHGAAANLRGAVEEADELLPDQQPGEHADRRAGVAAVEHVVRLLQAVKPRPWTISSVGVMHVDLHAQLAHHADRRAAVAAVEEVAHMRRAFRQCCRT